MLPLPNKSPFDGGEIVVTRFYCPDSAISVEGQFSVVAPFTQLSPEQLKFVETFVRCEGKLSRMEDELKLSYPTVRTRLHEVIRALGYEPGKDEPIPGPIPFTTQLVSLVFMSVVSGFQPDFTGPPKRGHYVRGG